MAKKKKPTKRRKRGRPKKLERPITPAVLEEIGIIWLKNVPLRTIAEELGVDDSTVRHRLDRTITAHASSPR